MPDGEVEERTRSQGRTRHTHCFLIYFSIKPFPHKRGAIARPARMRFRAMRRILRKAGLPDIRFHGLRHSAASLMLALNVHPRIVMELLGHSQISLTMDTYSHVVPDVLRDAVGKLGTALNGA
jgi:integrase